MWHNNVNEMYHVQMGQKLRRYDTADDIVVYELTKGFDHQLIRVMEEAEKTEEEEAAKNLIRDRKTEPNAKRKQTEENQAE